MELKIPSGFSERSLRFGDHLLYIYENDEQQFYTSMPFMKAGIENNEKCIYIGDADSSTKISDFLEKLNIDSEDTKKTGQLCIATYKDLFLNGGSFNLEKMRGLLRKTIENIPEEGWTGLRVVQEMSGLSRYFQENDTLLEYEGDLSYNIPKRSAVFLCQYDGRRFERKTLVQVLKLHNIVVVGDTIYENQLKVDLNEVLPIQNEGITHKIES